MRGPGWELLTPVQLGSTRCRANHMSPMTPGWGWRALCQSGAIGGSSHYLGLRSGQQQPARQSWGSLPQSQCSLRSEVMLREESQVSGSRQELDQPQTNFLSPCCKAKAPRDGPSVPEATQDFAMSGNVRLWIFLFLPLFTLTPSKTEVAAMGTGMANV